MKKHQLLGIDVGGSGMKGGIVDLRSGRLLTERHKVKTPQPATPKNMSRALAELLTKFDYEGPMGVGFPAIIKKGVSLTASNISKKWINVDVADQFSQVCGHPVHVINDADAAGLAEVHYGAAKGLKGTVLLITIGSGLGSALFTDGHLAYNTELGHLIFKGGIAEHYASSKAKKDQQLSTEVWATRFNEFLVYIKRLFSPNLVLLGGGISKSFDQFSPYLTVEMDVRPAVHRNEAGTIGAAFYAYTQLYGKLPEQK